MTYIRSTLMKKTLEKIKTKIEGLININSNFILAKNR